MNVAELQLQMRRGTAADWTSADPVILSGEIGYETDTGFWKWGDGVTAWTSLTYDHQFGGDVNIAGLLNGRTIGTDGATLDAHIADATIHFTQATIDAHIADATIHFTQAAIIITESQISDIGTHVHPPVTATTAQLIAIANPINTTPDKVPGYMVWNTDTEIPVWAIGDTDGAHWYDSAGVDTHTPDTSINADTGIMLIDGTDADLRYFFIDADAGAMLVDGTDAVLV